MVLTRDSVFTSLQITRGDNHKEMLEVDPFVGYPGVKCKDIDVWAVAVCRKEWLHYEYVIQHDIVLIYEKGGEITHYWLNVHLRIPEYIPTIDSVELENDKIVITWGKGNRRNVVPIEKIFPKEA